MGGNKGGCSKKNKKKNEKQKKVAKPLEKNCPGMGEDFNISSNSNVEIVFAFASVAANDSDSNQETVLQVPSNLHQECVTRKYYVDQLKRDLDSHYGDNDFLSDYTIDVLLMMFPPLDLIKIIETFVKRKPRTNTLKTHTHDLDPFSSQVPVGANAILESMAGHDMCELRSACNVPCLSGA
ncbi:hypothetical protein KY285_000925 [Solanum tuberosum]|nr:hypothetical protein KY285_000925 [Solanum tuberosum]